MVFYSLDDQHIVGLFAQGLEHVQERAASHAAQRLSEERVMASSCAVCEVHAESTFKVEGIDCREEVIAARAALQASRRASRTSPPTSCPGGCTSNTTRPSVSADAISAAVADTGHARLARARGAGRHRPDARGRAACSSAASGALLAAGLAADWQLTAGSLVPARPVCALARGRRASDHRQGLAGRAHALARHQRADARGGSRAPSCSANGPRRPPSCFSSPLRRRSKRGRSSVRGWPSARSWS